jgi:hypothetical protein
MNDIRYGHKKGKWYSNYFKIFLESQNMFYIASIKIIIP